MTILVAILGLILLIVVHELGHMLVAKALGVHVPEFGVGFGPALFKKKIGKTIYSFRIILLGGFARMEGMEGMAGVEEEKRGEFGPNAYPSKAAWRRALIIFAGPFANLLAAVVIFAAIFMYGVPTGATPEIQEVVPDSLAADVGLRPGDRVVEAGGEPVRTWEDFEGAVGGKQPDDEVAFAVERGGERLEYEGTLRPAPDEPERGIVGIQPAPEYADGPLEALWAGVERTVYIIGLFGWFVGQLFTTGDEITLSNSVSSPIGVVSVTSDVASRGLLNFAQLLAFISLNLAVFNLLPILPLDGGHLFFIAAEKVLGRPVRAETVGKVAALGLALILTLFLFATYADLSKIFTGQPFIPEQRP